jgi:hypothetical protein
MRVVLYWDRAPLQPIALELVNDYGQVVMRRQVATKAQALPWRERVDLAVTRTLSRGLYSLQLVAEGEPPFLLTRVRVADTLPLEPARGPEIGLGLVWGESLVLEGMGLIGEHDQAIELQPGDTLVLDLYWRVRKAPQADYTVFVHLVGDEFNPATQGPVWGQRDAQPLDGLWPTRVWREGEALVDRLPVMLDPAAPAGTYRLVVGLYRTDTLERVVVTDMRGQALGDYLPLGLPIIVRAR